VIRSTGMAAGPRKSAPAEPRVVEALSSI